MRRERDQRHCIFGRTPNRSGFNWRGKIPRVPRGYPAAFYLPTRCRPQHAEPTGIDTRMDAWSWVKTKIKENLNDSVWTHATRRGGVADVFARVSSQRSHCLFPLYITPTMARELVRGARNSDSGLPPLRAWICKAYIQPSLRFGPYPTGIWTVRVAVTYVRVEQ